MASTARADGSIDRADWLFAGGVIAAGSLVDWLCRVHPARLPPFMPWEFSWLAFAGTAFVPWWFFRGRRRLAAAERPGFWRIASFLTGMVLIYGVLQTRYLYFAEHMFFLNRLQHLAMHHLGPFLIALGLPGASIRSGLPKPLAELIRARGVARAIDAVQHPVVAPILFFGLLALWLIPPVHFAAMLDTRLFWIMNWSMVLDGVLFWGLVLDPRPSPAARTSYAVRILVALSVMVPQIIVGAVITFSERDLYPSYAFCGRAFADMSAGTDQSIGGIITWIPMTMMSAVAILVVLNRMRLDEESANGATERMVALRR